MKKRRSALLLATALLLTWLVAACGGGESPSTPADGSGENNSAPNNSADNNSVNNAVNNAVNNSSGVNNTVNNGVNNGVNNAPGNNSPVNNGVNNDVNNAPGNNNTPQDVTYYRDVKPILDRACTGCHAEGGVGPFALDTWAAVQPLANAIDFVVDAGTMPPWQPDPECRTFKGQRTLSAEQKATIRAWVQGGALEGDPADDQRLGPPTDLVLENPSLITRATEAYTPDPTRPDDYRCLVLDAEFPETTFLAAHQTVPDQRPIVHHVLFYLVTPDEVARLEELEGRDEAPGYECFGGPKVGNLLNTIAGWVPGATPTRFPEGSAYAIPAGSRIVMQVHYNTLNNPPATDRTEFHMKLYEGTPRNLIQILPLPNEGIEIEAGDPESVHDMLIPNIFGRELTVVGTAPHMHMLGSRFEVEVRRSNGQRECVVDIPEWDFNWQQFYELNDDDYIHIGAGDSIFMRCVYDNSPANQAVVNGEQLEPRDVDWGDGSLDEMCLNYLTTIQPYNPADVEGDCSAFPSCNMSCEPGDGFCTATCASFGGGICRECFAQAVASCGDRHCGSQLSPLYGCALGCLNEQDLGACFMDRCETAFNNLWSCLGPHVYNGDCNRDLDDCSITF